MPCAGEHTRRRNGRYGPCEQCGETFYQKRNAHGHQRFCSRECIDTKKRLDAAKTPPSKRGRETYKRRRKQRMRVQSGGAPPPTKLEILARDGWRCWLCGEPTPPFVHYNDRRAGTMDHVIPVAKGGGHTAGNVRAAHRQCNAERSAAEAA